MGDVNLYQESWELYKTHSDFFTYDFDYYYQFCYGKKTLEPFAGYGRLSNHLINKGVNLYTNELSPDFTSFINLEPSKKHIGDFLKYPLGDKFERIIIAYNSFSLITKEEEIRDMFSLIENLIERNGKISLSYYHPDYWPDDTIYKFKYKGEVINYQSKFDLSDRHNKNGIWQDLYEKDGAVITHSYNLRVYEDKNDLAKMISHTKLKIIGEIRNYNNKEISEEGWTEYVLQLG